MTITGAETGTGGRIRDTHATGTGSVMGVATAGYCVGNLRLEGYTQVGRQAFGVCVSCADPESILSNRPCAQPAGEIVQCCLTCEL